MNSNSVINALYVYDTFFDNSAYKTKHQSPCCVTYIHIVLENTLSKANQDFQNIQ